MPYSTPEKRKAYERANRKRIRSMDRARYKRDRTNRLAQSTARQKMLREKAIQKIAENRGDAVPRCRIDLTPSLVEVDVCAGWLEIDHLNGNPNKEGKSAGSFYRKIVVGLRSVEDLRILCRRHNLYYSAFLFGRKNLYGNKSGWKWK